MSSKKLDATEIAAQAQLMASQAALVFLSIDVGDQLQAENITYAAAKGLNTIHLEAQK